MKRITFLSIISSLVIICFFILVFTDLIIGFFICGLVIAIYSIYFTKEFLKTEKIIFDIESLPILKTDQAVEGVPFVGEGIIEAEQEKILISPYGKLPCVYYHSIKEEFIRSATSKEWNIIENIADFIPFYIKDKKGKLKIDITNLDYDFSKYKIPLRDKNVPDQKNSEIDCLKVFYRFLLKSEEKKEEDLIKDYYISEFVLMPQTKIFVCGMVSKRNGELVLHESEKIPLIISTKSRDKYVEEFYRGGNLIYLSHFLVALGFTVFLLGIKYFLEIESMLIFPFIFLGNTIILASSVFSMYNRIITLFNRALNAFSNIEIELKRRADLIPNIIEIVKAYEKHESEIQKIIAESRAEIVFSKELKKDENPIIEHLAVVIENYPELRAIDQFQSLMKILVDTEERIAYSREFYNRTVRKYNTLIKQIPFIIISVFLNIKEMEFLNIKRGEKEI